MSESINAWKFNLDGKLDLKSAYYLVANNEDDDPQTDHFLNFGWMLKASCHEKDVFSMENSTLQIALYISLLFSIEV